MLFVLRIEFSEVDRGVEARGNSYDIYARRKN